MDACFLREMVGSTAERLTEIEAPTSTVLGERSPDRLFQRNAYCERDRGPRAGTAELPILKPRKGPSFPASFEPQLMIERAPVAAIAGAPVSTVSRPASWTI